MSSRKRSNSESAIHDITKGIQRPKELAFNGSVPFKHAEAVNGQYINGLYQYKTYSKNDKGRVCTRCLRWSLTRTGGRSASFGDSDKKNNVVLEANWGCPVDMMESNCPVCRLFAMHAVDYQFINGPMAGRSYDLRELRIDLRHGQGESAVSSDGRFWYLDPNAARRSNFPPPAGEGACIGWTSAVVPSAPGNGLTSVLIDPDTINYSSVQSWISNCQHSHGEACNPKSRETMSSLRLIDCLSTPPRLVDAQPRHTYIALSYVWGRGGVGDHISGDTLIWRLLPRTIRDAMTVTRKLSLRYLWVDRYCIPADMLKEQIGQMDIIYAGAALVIVAAAGDHIDYGLPGVGARKRTPQQPYAIVGTDVFASTLSDLNAGLYNIAWWRRAWCFQEALLSRRRLIFTDEKVYFLCPEAFQLETLNMPLAKPRDRPYSSSAKGGASTDFYNWLTGNDAIGKKPRQIYRILSEYADKDMSFDSDGLNAIVGVLRAFQKASGKPKFHSYAGLPILGAPTRKAFLSALMWSTFIPGTRRTGRASNDDGSGDYFPSWSWIGWSGGFRYDDMGDREPDPDIRIRLVEADGTSTTSWRDFATSGRLADTVFPLSRFLELYVQTAPVRLQYMTTPRIQGGGGCYMVRVQGLPGNKTRYAQVHLCCTHFLPSGEVDPVLKNDLTMRDLKCIFLLPRDNETRKYGIGWVLRDVDGVSEKVGSFQIDYMGDFYDADGAYAGFIMPDDENVRVEGFETTREWVRIG